MLPQFPLPAWLDGFGSAVSLMALIGWAASAVLVVVGAVALVREARRRRRVALADAVAEGRGLARPERTRRRIRR
ncbi:hypothetical protein [Quadrisphaera setariae]|uniref:Heme exporter protein D n=1 Tax=Quadrisphaera setariae TaxID=2593304 RepID=A0A5C8Z0L5_9ACTN|nr:hypothetical protein [Quadrisphaera setariae]TXR51665.1 hypothetical protein FMM08_21795 [Quadrisphaera setariae]